MGMSHGAVAIETSKKLLKTLNSEFLYDLAILLWDEIKIHEKSKRIKQKILCTDDCGSVIYNSSSMEGA